ncbi:MAG: DUF4179 domain-containing protein, partial [Oscillospiraceae bacterium]|nr:DUF4179 domain-containing protein [Oscillospiraceae bacterium]
AELIDRTKEVVLRGCRERKGSARRFRFKPVVAAAAVIAVLVGLTPVMAANNESVNDALYMVAPTLAQNLKPVNMSCEDNGIRMEVISCDIEGDTANVLISLTDLEGDRVDATTDLYDSYTIRTPRGMIGHCERVSYDGQSGTCTFLTTLESMDGKDLVTGGKVTFSVREFLSGGRRLENVSVPLELDVLPQYDEAQSNLEYVTVPLDGSNVKYTFGKAKTDDMGGMTVSFMNDFDVNGGSFTDEASTEAVLMFPKDELYSPAQNITVTNAAVIDGKLHVQVRTDSKRELDTHGYVYLRLPGGEILDSRESFSFRYKGSKMDDGKLNISASKDSDHCEFIFDTEDIDLSQCQLYGSFYTNALNTKGKWSVTFPIQ